MICSGLCFFTSRGFESRSLRVLLKRQKLAGKMTSYSLFTHGGVGPGPRPGLRGGGVDEQV